MSTLPSANSREKPMMLQQEEGNPMMADEDDDDAVDAAEGASELSSVFNLSNSILGSGTLAMPYACHQCGILGFLGLLALVGAIAKFSLDLLVVSLEQNASRTLDGSVVPLDYGSLAEKVIGRHYQKAAAWAVIVQQLGACVAYIVIIADVIQPIAGLSADTPQSLLCDRALYQVGIAVCIIFPLCMLRSMEKLQYTSLAALLCIISFVLVVSFLGLWSAVEPSTRSDIIMGRGALAGDLGRDGKLRGAEDPHCLAVAPKVSGMDVRAFHNESAVSVHAHFVPAHAGLKLFPDSLRQVTSAVPILCFAFLCHMNIFPIYNELRQGPPSDGGRISHTSSNRAAGPSKKLSMQRVGLRSMLLCGLVYSLSGVFGYLCFLETTKPDLLKNFKVVGSSVSGIMDVLRVGFGFALIFSYPIVVWEARHMLSQELLGGIDTSCCGWRCQCQKEGEDEEEASATLGRYSAVTDESASTHAIPGTGAGAGAGAGAAKLELRDASNGLLAIAGQHRH